jgi:hypothetical protein
MSLRRRWDINTRTQLISLGPALLLTLLLISFFTFVRIQDLRQELNHTGQLIANQLAPATEYGVISGNNEVLESLLKATLATPNVRFLEVQDSANRILAYVEQPSTRTTGHIRSKCSRRPCACSGSPCTTIFFRTPNSAQRCPVRIIWGE